MLDYSVIKKKLKDAYKIEKFDQTSFERSKLFTSKLDEAAYVRAYVKYDMGLEENVAVNEDGVACATLGNTSGMGPVVSAQPSSVPGQTTGADFAKNGGTVGSGDISAGSNRNVRSRDVVPGRKRRKDKLQAVAKAMSKQAGSGSAKISTKFDPAVPTKPSTVIKSFSDYSKKK